MSGIFNVENSFSLKDTQSSYLNTKVANVPIAKFANVKTIAFDKV
jgi:hypothetical protein